MSITDLTSDIRAMLADVAAKLDSIDALAGEPPLAWPPTLGGNLPDYAADYAGGQYWAGGAVPSFAEFLAAVGGTRNGPPPTSAGLSLQGPRTNILWPSNDFTSARWTKSRVTTTPNAVMAPDGTLTASTVTDNSTPGTHELYQAIAVASGAAYAHAIQVKAGTGALGRIWFTNGGYAYYADFNLTAGTIGAATNLTTEQPTTPIQSFIEPLGDGWYRAGVAGSAALTTGYFVLSMRNSAGAISYAGSGSTLHVWQAQTEAGRFPTSVISTTTAAATRDGERLVRNITSPSAITKVITARTAKGFAPDFDVLWHMDNDINTASGYRDLEIFRDSAGHLILRVSYTTTTHHEIDFGVMGNDTAFTLALTASAAGLLASLNGAAELSAPVTAWPTDLIRDRYGVQMGTIREWYGALGSDMTWFAAATGSELRALSA